MNVIELLDQEGLCNSLFKYCDLPTALRLAQLSPSIGNFVKDKWRPQCITLGHIFKENDEDYPHKQLPVPEPPWASLKHIFDFSVLTFSNSILKLNNSILKHVKVIRHSYLSPDSVLPSYDFKSSKFDDISNHGRGGELCRAAELFEIIARCSKNLEELDLAFPPAHDETYAEQRNRDLREVLNKSFSIRIRQLLALKPLSFDNLRKLRLSGSIVRLFLIFCVMNGLDSFAKVTDLDLHAGELLDEIGMISQHFDDLVPLDGLFPAVRNCRLRWPIRSNRCTAVVMCLAALIYGGKSLQVLALGPDDQPTAVSETSESFVLVRLFVGRHRLLNSQSLRKVQLSRTEDVRLISATLEGVPDAVVVSTSLEVPSAGSVEVALQYLDQYNRSVFAEPPNTRRRPIEEIRCRGTISAVLKSSDHDSVNVVGVKRIVFEGLSSIPDSAILAPWLAVSEPLDLVEIKIALGARFELDKFRGALSRSCEGIRKARSILLRPMGSQWTKAQWEKLFQKNT